MLTGALSNIQTLCLYCTKVFCFKSHKHTWLWNWRCFMCGSHCSDIFCSSKWKSFCSLLIIVCPWMFREKIFYFFFYLSKGLRVNTLLYCEKADVGAKLRRCHCIPYQSTNSLFSSKILLKKANVCSGTTVCVSHKDKKNIYNRGL